MNDMKHRKQLSAFRPLMLVVFLFPALGNAQEVYDLKRCLETALEKNYDIRIVRNEQRISTNNATLGNAGLLPSLDLSAGYSGSLNNTTQDFTEGTSAKNNNILNQGANLGLNMTWTVFDGFSMQTNYKRLKEFEAMGELNTRLAVENLVANLASEYYNNVRQNLRLANLKYAVSLSKERLRIAEANYNVGAKSRLDFQQARVDFNADSSNLIKQYEVVYSSGIALNQLMALEDVSRQLNVPDSVIVPDSSLNEEILQEQTLRANSRLLLSVKNQSINELNLRAIRGRDYPYLRLNAGYGYTLNAYGSGSMEKQQNLGLNYGLTLGFNLFDGFNRQREKKNARIAIQNQELLYEQLELSLKADLANTWMAYKNNLELINLEKENLEAARENYSIAIDRYRLGDLSGFELREAQNSLLNAEERLLQAQFSTKLCEISLLQISGQMNTYLE
jgi:outer membrane protein TolC